MQTMKPPSVSTVRRHVRFPLWTATGAIALFLLHAIYVIFGPERRLMDWLYDDCFYYLITASHLASQGISSFDGITRTTGYHPLWMWLCMLLFTLHPHLDLFLVRLAMSVSAVISSGILIGAFLWARSLGNVGWLWTLALAATSYSAWNNGFTIMEWPLVLACWVGLHVQLERATTSPHQFSRLSLLLALLIGLLGTLSRSDFGLIPACYVVAVFVVEQRSLRSSVGRHSTYALAGSIVGMGLLSLYNHALTGVWVQQSAIVKHLLASATVPFSPAPAAWQFSRVVLFLPRLDLSPEQQLRAMWIGNFPVAVIAGVALVALKRRGGRRRRTSITTDPTVPTISTVAAVLGVTGYLIVYSFNSRAMYGWYSACVTGFILILTARLFSTVPPKFIPVITLPILAVNLAGFIYGGANASTQYAEVLTGKVLHTLYPAMTLGGGDVGKPSFYNNGTVINTDGLMNNEIVPYLAAGRFPCYALDRHIKYLSNVGSVTYVLTNAVRSRRHEAAIPWDLYFQPKHQDVPEGRADFVETNFAAIEASHECDQLSGIVRPEASPVRIQ